MCAWNLRRPAGSAQRRPGRAAQWRPARLLGVTAVPDGGAHVAVRHAVTVDLRGVYSRTEPDGLREVQRLRSDCENPRIIDLLGPVAWRVGRPDQASRQAGPDRGVRREHSSLRFPAEGRRGLAAVEAKASDEICTRRRTLAASISSSVMPPTATCSPRPGSNTSACARNCRNRSPGRSPSPLRSAQFGVASSSDLGSQPAWPGGYSHLRSGEWQGRQ